MILDRVPVSMSRKNIIIIINIIIIRWSVAAPHLCDVKCGKEITCQSYNYNRKYQICELNNRTKEAKTENFLSAPAWFYIRRLNGIGKKSEVDFCFSRFSPHIANLVLSHLWLRNIKKRKQNSSFYCSPIGFYFEITGDILSRNKGEWW